MYKPLNTLYLLRGEELCCDCLSWHFQTASSSSECAYLHLLPDGRSGKFWQSECHGRVGLVLICESLQVKNNTGNAAVQYNIQ